ncbi:T9SS type A sorting domain-containing protein [Aestuariibaculum sp. YM273]|uniref:T9SS type A sorting domain-containing protein n=1 Tax=Aestuariibaculum sp. YM273 TaxID=3070659 RepID=UPI0027DDA02F|nr:T9SS type A sorting domain-containing protein [Aestuariibaculum sp. YM273]WMI64317.1 T9SS type A sorting domain-containing protein [Aestuariibaculum sp. YM273]
MKTKLLLLATLLTSMIALAQIPTTGLSRSYLFTNGSIQNDVSPGTYDLNIDSVNNIQQTQDVLGNYGGALDLNNTRLNGGLHPTGTGDFTISLWLKTSSGSARILEQYNDIATFNAGYYLDLIFNGTLVFVGSFRYGSNYSTDGVVVSSAINDDEWHHVTITGEEITRVQTFPSGPPQNYFSYRYSMYVDGVLISTDDTSEIAEQSGSSLNSYLFSNSPDLRIGLGYQDVIDNYREYTRALTQSEILALSNEFINISYIDQDATGTNDGSSWTNAYTDITSALENAADNSEFWIKGGTYVPTTSVGGNQNTGITITARGVKIYGGFAGTETQLNERVFGNNETIISGDVNGDDGTAIPDFTFGASTTSDNFGRLLRIDNFSVTNMTIIDGLTFTRAYSQTGAGAIRLAQPNNEFPNISFNNCKFTNNLQQNGAGIYLNYRSNLTTYNTAGLGIYINQCVFENNVAKLGGGIYISNNDDSFSSFVNASIKISNTLFNHNIVKDNVFDTQGQFASAMRIIQADPQSTFSTTISNCTFVKNREEATLYQARDRFVVVLEALPTASVHTVSLVNNIFWGNESSNGVIVNSVGDSGIPSALNLYNNTAEDNFSNISSAQQTATLNTSPDFTDFLANDFTLQNTSPAINNGDNTFVIGSVDLLNNPRIVNTTVDRGAFEFDNALSINDYTLVKKFFVYPNPVQSMLNIKSDFNIESLSLYSVLGNYIKTVKNINAIDVSDLKSGIYLVRVTIKGKVTTLKFVKN